MELRYIPVLLLEDLSGLTVRQIIDKRVEQANKISKLLYQISRPAAISVGYRTTHLWGVTYDYDFNMTDVYFETSPQQTTPVNRLAESEMIIRGVFEDYKTIGMITENQILALIDLLEASKGGRIAPYDFIPAFMRQQSVSRNYLRSLGWFPEYNDETGEIIPYVPVD